LFSELKEEIDHIVLAQLVPTTHLGKSSAPVKNLPFLKIMDRHQLLPVGSLPVGLPSSGEEYLAMVREEERKLPNWTRTTKKLKTDSAPTILEDAQAIFTAKDELFTIPEQMLPTEAWKLRRLNEYRMYKNNLSKIPKLDLPKTKMEDLLKEMEPKIGYAINWTQPQVLSLLEKHIGWVHHPNVRMVH
jgi:hypothetical protein